MPTTDTKRRLLDAAETLFAEHGFAATSLRHITAVAKVNLASVNYHFGSKEALLSAVFERRLGAVNQERVRRLDALEAAAKGRRIEVEALLGAFLTPPFEKMRELGERGLKFMQLLGRTYSETNDQIRTLSWGQFEGILQRFGAALEKALPDVPPPEVRRRLHFVVGAMAHTLAWCHKSHHLLLAPLGKPGSDSQAILEDLIQFTAAGMKASLPPPPRGARK
ncbi:MAG: TetR/AcrR family transcriptional regulator [Acidobacteriota bacterium]